MEADPFITNYAQPTLFDLGETSFGVLELFPSVWGAAEALTSPELGVRQSGLERITELNAARFSPLIAYIIATRLTDPDLGLRTQIVRTLAGVLAPDEQGQPAPEIVRWHLKTYLSQMRTRKIYALLQVADFDPDCEPAIASLLNACPYAGNHLSSILLERKVPLAIRIKAADFIGRVGYVGAITTLERIVTRLESKLNGQQAMPFIAYDGGSDEGELLPAVKHALTLLRTP